MSFGCSSVLPIRLTPASSKGISCSLSCVNAKPLIKQRVKRSQRNDSMPLDPTFDRCFAPLIGLPCWHVKPGYGSFITLEFGEPRLEIREPKDARKDATPKVRKIFSQRKVTVRGQWHLWVYCCNWSIMKRDHIVGCSTDNDTVPAGTQFLDGQILTNATTDSSFSSRFTFDLDGELTTRPRDADSEQWMLYQPDGNVLSLRGDGTYCHSPSNTEQEHEQWMPAWKP